MVLGYNYLQHRKLKEIVFCTNNICVDIVTLISPYTVIGFNDFYVSWLLLMTFKLHRH